MEPLAILQADPLDLLFENRNKQYGAYPLRKYYPRRLYLAMATVLAAVLIFSCCVLLSRSKAGPAPVFDLPDLTPVALSPNPLTVQPPAKRVRVHIPPASSTYTPPLIVRTELADKPMAAIADLATTTISTTTQAGPPASGDEPAQAGAPAGSGAPDSAAKKPDVLWHADRMPEFPGGVEALKRFLLKNLRMPETGLEAGSQVRVLARFIVDADGKVRGIETVQSGGQAFDREVLRVIDRMPDWKPGVQANEKVAVYFQLPVYFVVPAEN